MSDGEQRPTQAWLCAALPWRQSSPEPLLRLTEPFSLGSSLKFRSCFAFQIYELFSIWKLLLNKGLTCSVGWRKLLKTFWLLQVVVERYSWRKWPGGKIEKFLSHRVVLLLSHILVFILLLFSAYRGFHAMVITGVLDAFFFLEDRVLKW